jgi:hypothetical protein
MVAITLLVDDEYGSAACARAFFLASPDTPRGESATKARFVRFTGKYIKGGS